MQIEAVAVASGQECRVAVIDITERKRVEEEREQLLVELDAVLNSINEGVIISDLEGNVLTMNPSALAIHEYESVEQVRRQLYQYQETFELSDLDGHPVPFEQWPLARVLRGERFTDYEVRVRRKDTGKSGSAASAAHLCRPSRATSSSPSSRCATSPSASGRRRRSRC